MQWLGGPPMWLKVLLYAFILVNLADGLLTFYGVGWKGGYEQSAMVLFLINIFGLGFGLIVAKFLAIGGGILLYRIYKKYNFFYRLAIIATFIYSIFIMSADCTRAVWLIWFK